MELWILLARQHQTGVRGDRQVDHVLLKFRLQQVSLVLWESSFSRLHNSVSQSRPSHGPSDQRRAERGLLLLPDPTQVQEEAQETLGAQR